MKLSKLKKTDLAKSNDINTEKDFEDLVKNIGSSQFDDTSSIGTEFVEEDIKERASEKLASLKRSKSEEKSNKPKPREQSSTPKKPQNDEAEANRITEIKYHVKQNIRKIIQRYKSRRIDDELSNKTKPKAASHTKDTIKNQDSRFKIQQQIMDIIENNQRITNKELIKSKLQDTIMKELVNLIDSTSIDDDREKKQIEHSEVIDVLGDEIKSELEKEPGEDLKAPFMDIKMKMKNREHVKIVLFEIFQQ
ncbi:hypothetical protein JTB14_017736 [Gonioctena quinquepunctata]|nr:hypothetical protein JTB14_017736 [Gonioctena quinquepunctata]